MPRKYKPTNDNEFLDHMAMIIFVAGFRYSIVKERWPKITKAFSNFNIKKLSKYTSKDIDKLMKADGMIKNRGKIEAIIANAQICVELQKEHGSVLKWIDKLKKNHKKNPLFSPPLSQEFQRFVRVGKTTSGWLESLHMAKGKYLDYKME